MSVSKKSSDGGQVASVKESMLHGHSDMENRPAKKSVNSVDDGGDMAESVRKASTLDYLEGDVAGRQSAFMRDNPEMIVHEETDELYPR